VNEVGRGLLTVRVLAPHEQAQDRRHAEDERYQIAEHPFLPVRRLSSATWKTESAAAKPRRSDSPDRRCALEREDQAVIVPETLQRVVGVARR
jgi:hypothetical protein